MGGTRFMVQWEEHPSHLATRLGQLLEHQTLVDVTLMCNTHTLRVHRAVLAACSPYFETILQRQLGMYPLIVLKDMQFSVLKSLIEFMYCGETSVTEDNLSALLQAAKFFQVKGLSAMTKEALGLTSAPPPKITTTVNGEAARKAFVGRSKRVGMQQTFVASGLKTLSAAGSHVHGPGGDVQTTPTGKTIFQTTPKSVPLRQDTHHHQQQQQQQQTDTAQLLLSLSGSEFPKQTFHTVSKNVKFHHGISSSSAVTVEPSRTCSLESSVVKNKEAAVRSEVIDRVPVVTPNSGVKPTPVILPTQLAEKTVEQQIVPEKIVEATKEDLTSQMIYVEEGPCKRGRPLKRQMNLVFQEKVLTDAELALQKEAEASRKALEMLQQEMSTGDEASGTVVTQASETVKQKILPVKPLTKLQPSQANNMTSTTRILPKESVSTSKLTAQKTNVVTQVTAVNTPETGSQNVIYQVAGNTLPTIDSSSNETNIVYQLQEGVIAGQDSSSGANIVYQVADSTVLTGQDPNNQNIIYQVADNAGTSTEGSNNTNIIYQVDGNNTGSGTTVSQYMEVLKEAGLPSDVPILLESSDGSYVTVNEEVLMNIMNGGMIQVSDGSIVGGEGVQFIVQEVQEVNEGQVENATSSTEQATTEENVTTVSDAAGSSVGEIRPTSSKETKMLKEAEVVDVTVKNVPKHSTYKSAKGQQVKSNVLKSLPPLEAQATEKVHEEKITAPPCEEVRKETEVEESIPMEVDEPEQGSECIPPAISEPPTHSDEVITGDSYGEEAMEGFAVTEVKEKEKEAQNIESVKTDTVLHDETKSPETSSKKLVPASEPVKEPRSEEAPSNSGMSVEQALQAMMGESSDTEMEVCAKTERDGSTKVKPVIAHKETKDHTIPTEESVDEETEDLRLVLSPEDDSVKVEDESQSAGEGSLNDSFTLALSSPDSTGNEKAHLESENVTDTTEGSQVETKPVETGNEPEGVETERVSKITEETKYPHDSSLKSKSNSTTNASVTEDVAKSARGEFPSDSSSVEIDTEKQTTPAEPMSDQSECDVTQENVKEVPLMLSAEAVPSSTLLDETEPLVSDKELLPDKAESTEIENLMFHHSEKSASEETSGKVDVTENVEALQESDTSLALGTENIDNAEIDKSHSESDTAEPLHFSVSDTSSDPDIAFNRSDSEVGKSLPILSTFDDSNVSIESDNLTDTSKQASAADKEVSDREMENSSIAELPPAESASTTETSLCKTSESNVFEESENIDSEKVTSNQDAEIKTVTKSDTEDTIDSAIGTENMANKNDLEESATKVSSDVKTGEKCGPEIDNKSDSKIEAEEEEGMKKDEVTAPENLEGTEQGAHVPVDENGVQAEGTVTSPNKDIRYAVGLLPLKTALEKFQAMSEYHPRKTRSASSGKEQASDGPAGRLKRKSSSSTERSEKKLKSEEGDCSFENDGTISEEFEESTDEQAIMDVTEAESRTKVESPLPEDSVGMTVENKVESLPSMMELVSESNETV